MNSKRQTIWLVSMLSLMVVLSAYYLFTEDVNKLNVGTDKAAQEDIKVTTQTVDPQSAEQAAAGSSKADKAVDAKGEAGKSASGGAKAADANSSSAKATDAKSQDAKGNDAKAADAKSSGTNSTDAKSTDAKSTDAKSGDKSASAQSDDAKVLEKLQTSASSGADYFAAQYMKRNEDLQKQTDTIMAILSDTKQNPDAIANATNDLDKIQTKQAKVENVEDLLAKDYSNAIVLEEGGKYKVVVQAEKLERSQAQSIIDLVLKELDTVKDNISVQYMR